MGVPRVFYDYNLSAPVTNVNVKLGLKYKAVCLRQGVVFFPSILNWSSRNKSGPASFRLLFFGEHDFQLFVIVMDIFISWIYYALA